MEQERLAMIKVNLTELLGKNNVSDLVLVRFAASSIPGG
jgi:hypothetical protein